MALQRLVDQQQREPLAVLFGDGLASSSDGQFFRAGGFGRNASSLNAHYGDDPGVKFYTHLSDRYAPFHTKVIAATASEAVHVIDGLLYQTGCSIIRVMSRPTVTTPMAGVIPTTSSPCVRCSGFSLHRVSRT